MKKAIYVIVRYSVLIENSKSWTITDPDLDEYRRKLFDTKRLESRLNLFKNITLPSLIGQEYFIKENNVKLMLISSEELPEWNKREIDILTSNYDWISVHYLPVKGTSLVQPVYDDLKTYNEEVLYATIRLDDDDALSFDFFEEFDKFLVPSNIGYAVSFGKGLCGFFDFDLNQYYKVIDYYYPKLALGLGYINLFDGNNFAKKIKTIFQAGGHTKVDQYVPTILYSKNIMYIRTMYEDSDSHQDKRFKKLEKMPSVESDILETRFTLPLFDKNKYMKNNNSAAYNIKTLDRTRYNKRFDLVLGERVYHYEYKGLDLVFYADFKNKDDKVLLISPNEGVNNYDFLDNNLVINFEGTKVIFIKVSSNSKERPSSLEINTKNVVSTLLKEFVSRLVSSNLLEENSITYLEDL